MSSASSVSATRLSRSVYIAVTDKDRIGVHAMHLHRHPSGQAVQQMLKPVRRSKNSARVRRPGLGQLLRRKYAEKNPA